MEGLTLGAAKAIVGSMGFPSKMPGTSYALPAKACIAGAALAKIPGTTCHSCYALGGGAKYQMPRAALGLQKRLEAIHHPRWVDAMVRLLRHYHSGPIKVDLGIAGVRLECAGGQRYRYNPPGFHRWHDSGDLQSVEHFARIRSVVAATPTIRHWLPTQELRFIARYIRDGGSVPTNLTIRPSSIFVAGITPRSWPTISSVFTMRPPAGAHVCPAPQQGHECRNCRACWDPAVAHVAYHIH